MKVLVTGVAGKLGRLVGERLLEAGHRVIGIDRRADADLPQQLTLYQCDVRKREAEDVFRVERPDALIHMATVTHIKQRSDDRFRINLFGTRAVFDHCHAYGTKVAVFVGRHTYYGAAADAPLYHQEADPPVAATSFPELADLIAADLYAGSALWRYPELQTSVLRICYSLGPARHGTLAGFLSGRRVPTVLGYDPLFQIMHERDVAKAIVLAFEKQLRGVYNVAGPPPLPLSVLIRETGRQHVPVPEFLFRLAVGRFGLPRLPRGALDHIKFPVIIDDSRFRQATGFAHDHDEDRAMADFRTAAG
ncbi:MAG TPA: NAD-dependent epimerase/dehydratase family protein [Kofleriaceae bacterium]|jgi:UDP-glucose 4-epimerase|nr:NAD-dependent epimerase/dehydratase family protein [Kofleriaceae bacterium]